MGWEIRQVRPSDLPEVERLWAADRAESPAPGFTPAQIAAMQSQLLHQVVVGEAPGLALYAPEGGVMLGRLIHHVLYDSGVYVVPELRRKGLATALLRTALRWAKDAGVVRVCASPYTSNAVCLGWLARAGFEPAQIVMALDLEA